MNSEDRAYARGVPRHLHRKTTRKMRWWYESLADYMVANPHATQNEIAAHFGRAPTTISTIINADSFIAYFRQRRDKQAEFIDAGVRSKMLNIADKSMDLILNNLDKKRDTIPLELLQRVNENALKNLGYGAAAPGPSTVVNVGQGGGQLQLVPVPVSIQDLEAARAALRRSQTQVLEAPRMEIVEGEFTEVDPAKREAAE